MSPELEAVAVAAGSAAAVGGLGAAATVIVARRSVPVATALGPIVVVLSMAAGIWVTAQAMFLSAHDFALISLVLAACVPVAFICGFLLYRAVRGIDRSAARAGAQREKEQSLTASRREMISWASHDLKSPLAGITIMAEALQDGMAPDPAEYHRRIRRESARMNRMVDDLLEMSRLNQGVPDTALSTVDLSELTRDVVHSQQVVAEAQQVSLDLGHNCSLPVRVDATRIERAVANVVRNAILYTPSGGAVRIRLDATSDDSPGTRLARLQVSDTCGGLDAQDLARMFEPGWRGSASRTPQAGAGVGVGLTITQAIVTEAGGRVQVASRADGCRVSLLLPMTQ